MEAAESAFIGAKSRAIPVYSAGMIDTVGPEHGRVIQSLVTFFLPRCRDQSVRELEEMAADNNRWRHGHALFCRIRTKTLSAHEAGNRLLQHQYLFEEICAKTLYNMSGHGTGREWPGPFNPDSPSWALPIAVGFARALGLKHLREVIK